MNILTVDTSVFIKWLNKDNERDLDKADEILQDVRQGRVELIAPELIKYEVGNVLLKGKQLTVDQAHISLGTAYSLPITIVPQTESLSKETYLLADKYNISFYDASFLSLAKQYASTLVTDNVKHQGKSAEVKVISLKDYSSKNIQ